MRRYTTMAWDTAEVAAATPPYPLPASVLPESVPPALVLPESPTDAGNHDSSTQPAAQRSPDPAEPVFYNRPPRWHFVRAIREQFEVPAPHVLEIDGAQISVRDGGGPGQPLLLIHGWSADGLLNWGSTYAPLYRDGWRPISFDLPGHGSSRDPQAVSIERCAQLASGVLDLLHASPAVVVGYSLGGPVSQTLARNHPHQVAGLVQVATGARNLPNDLLRPGARIGSVLAAQGIRIGHRALHHGMAPAIGDGDHHSMLAHTAWLARTMGYSDLAALGLELAAYDSRSWIHDLTAPAHCVITDGDRLVRDHVQDELAELLNASVTHATGGHMACITRPFPNDIVIGARSVRGHMGALSAGHTAP